MVNKAIWLVLAAFWIAVWGNELYHQQPERHASAAMAVASMAMFTKKDMWE